MKFVNYAIINTIAPKSIATITLSVEFSAESLALFLRLESVGITTAAAVNERLTHLTFRVVIIRGDGILAIAVID